VASPPAFFGMSERRPGPERRPRFPKIACHPDRSRNDGT
jgi:hypothetical protein